ncbi:MAG: hypothetical protein AAF738_08115 [Bacteroidota bacterium]
MRGLDLVLTQDMNVRVVLLPTGEDPDSLLQRLGSTAFETYIHEEAQDFILFKTNLLIEAAANDPIKKAGLVKSIVGSIAKVPDPIKRAFYVKECANLMDLEESILVAETNRVVEGNVKREQSRMNRANRRMQQRVQSSSAPLNVVQKSPNSRQDQTKITPEARKTSSAGDEFQEKDIVRLLIVAGSEVFDAEEKISVAEFILSNIEDVLENFDNKLYQTVAQEAFNRIVQQQSLDLNYFLMHPNEAIKQLALEVTTSPFEYSPGWDKKEIYLRTQKMPDLNFNVDSVQALMRFKFRKVIRMCEDNQKRLKAVTNEQELITLLQVQQKLIQMRNALAKQLKTVVMK